MVEESQVASDLYWLFGGRHREAVLNEEQCETLRMVFITAMQETYMTAGTNNIDQGAQRSPPVHAVQCHIRIATKIQLTIYRYLCGGRTSLKFSLTQQNTIHRYVAAIGLVRSQSRQGIYNGGARWEGHSKRRGQGGSSTTSV